MLFYLYNIFYHIVERFSLIRGYRHGWSNHVKTSCIFVLIIFYLFVLELLSSTLVSKSRFRLGHVGKSSNVKHRW